MTKLGTRRASRSKWVTAEQGTEFLPMHRADVVAAIEPLTPSILDLLAKPVHASGVPSDPVVRVVSTQLLVKLLLLFVNRQVPIAAAPLIDATHGAGETIRGSLQLDHPVTFQRNSPVVSESKKVEGTRRIVSSVVILGL